MRSLFALMVVVAVACGGGGAKKESSIVEEGSAATGETCCCKSTPMTGDGTPQYENDLGRIECSSKQGECVDEVQCNGAQPVDSEPGSEGMSAPVGDMPSE